MKMTKILSTALVTILAGVGCANESATLFETPIPPERKEFKTAEATARGESMKYDPRVDILFVIDDSKSMENHQANLRRNIDKFLKAIDKTKVIDFHIGVTTVYDSTRYGTIVPKTCPGFQENGVLQPLKGLSTPAEERFVTRKEGYLQVLQSTLNVGAKDFYNKDLCQTGPEIEESFSPLLESFNDANQTGANKGFWRPDTLKIVILVTDAVDSSPDLSASRVAEELYRLSQSSPNDQKFRVYAVTPVPGTKINPKTGKALALNSNGKWVETACKLDPAFMKPDKKSWLSEVPNHGIAQLVKSTNGKLLSICNPDYGTELGRFGEEIRQATLKNIVYDLPFLRDETPGRELQVWFKKNKQLSVKLTEGKDWYHNRQTNKIVVYGINLDWDNNPDAYIDVDYFPVDPNNAENQVIQ